WPTSRSSIWGDENGSSYDVSVPMSLRSLPRLPRQRVLVLIVLVGLFGGVVGSVYMLVLKELTELMGPDRWDAASHLAVLLGVGAVVGLTIRWLGKPDDVELLVDNIHVQGGNDQV